ncbi:MULTISPECIES: flagellar basal body L-ring protein FlgH [Paraburkholderia]|uniref:flagellar basal body L-ring protein FlgH n=1 Tax=Paraburkholderia TaxID=1822464 RepID=UPI00225A1683|nr:MULTISPECIES: flagellar basal body L-ring protein FlgH [Paraburkholderia]MCX4165772.1 flagellar basal body L-ring protein FlgH [Paraburkholderia megapolitana]MDN7161263.1 flagellar basal body L-ring protein FlgH [Paraburkholderia sp. CHISQ3]MDQ6498310.1 flagellar basal body L-ring protein FlgH [Paraburkholderia megapolitana]
MISHRILVAATTVVCVAACSSGPHSIVDTPMYAPLAATPLNVNTQGAIYQAGNALSLYETPRAQHIGDVLTIRLAESYSDNSSANASASRASNISAQAADQSTNAAAKLAKLFNVGSASTTFNGQGSVSDTSGMSGTLAVTVIGTLPTGNLVVSGEKIIAMNGNRDTLRLSGVVNPKDIDMGNYVASSKVANARIEQAGVGMLADSTTMGWLQRLFMSVLTF